ncbi:MAG: ATP-binding cassette domain-containing protein [Deltaproteobacteria bacterium]|nr:ATP-binding cassette domain-containing protein [Deltaproteobacteria bacterium]
MSEQTNKPLVEISDLTVYFPVFKGILGKRKVGDIKAVDGINLYVNKGETLGLVGESGCGKSTTGLAVLQLIRPTSGSVLFEGTDITRLNDRELRPIRSKMQIIFQDPFSSLNPRMTVGDFVGEPLLVHNRVKDKSDLYQRIEELFKIVGLDTGMASRYPHEFSGGQRQRIGVARALALKPSFIICDEPVSALDVSIQAQIINLLEELQDEFHLTYLFIAHDLAVVRHISDRIAVMYLGDIVEIADRNDLYLDPLHPYTKALLSVVPIPDPAVEELREEVLLEGEVPSPLNPPTGCKFHPRCPFLMKPVCLEKKPVLKLMKGSGQRVACHLY